MRLNFITNDYFLIWNLLYGSSFSETIHTFKQKLYKTHRNQYMKLEKDKKEMLTDIKNFIPDDDTLYHLVLQTDIFNKLKEDTEKHRQILLRAWDQYKKIISKSTNEILKFPLKEEYNIIVLNPIMDSILSVGDSNNIGWGTRKDLKNLALTITNIIHYIVASEVDQFDSEYDDIVESILELVNNELYARISGKSIYLEQDKSLNFLKGQIYPYWLMYLGCEKEDFPRYMMRDKVAFDIDSYAIDKNIRKINLFDFIQFCINNQKQIIRIQQLEII